MYDAITVAVDEIWLKSERVKNKLIKLLAKDIKNRIKSEKIKIGRGRIFIFDYKNEWINILTKTFGIRKIYVCKFCKSEIEEIKKLALSFLKDFKGTFKVEVNRVDKKFPLNSLEIAKVIGSYILENNPELKVNVKKPDKKIYIEIHKNFTLLSDKELDGPGGLPLGAEGKGLVLFSAGIDSPVAAYLIGKRGLNLDFLFVNIAGKSYLNFVYRVFNKIKEYFPYSKLFVYELDIEKLMQVRKGYKQIMFKVILYKIAEQFAKFKNYDIIVTGESLAQVSSQTLESIKVLDEFISIPILRPLIGFNKEEIINLSKKIGTFEIKAPEICQLEKHPTTKPKKEIILEELNKINIDFEAEAKNIKEIGEKDLESISEFLFSLPKKDELSIVFVDEIEKIKMEKSKKYLFICKTGALAKYFAEKFRKEGFEAYYLDEKTAKRLGYI